MERRPWLERVAAELDRRGVPAGYRYRLLAELADHVDDLTDEGSPMTEERMGRPEALASAAEQCCGGWIRRHPLLVFGLGPIPAAIGAAVGTVIAVGLIAWASDSLTGWSASSARPVVGRAYFYTFDIAFRFWPALLTAALFTQLVVRSGTDRRWLAAAVFQLAVLAGCLKTHSHYSDLPGQTCIGFTFPLLDQTGRFDQYLTPGQFLQAAVPVVAGFGLAWRFRRSAGPVAVI